MKVTTVALIFLTAFTYCSFRAAGIDLFSKSTTALLTKYVGQPPSPDVPDLR